MRILEENLYFDGDEKRKSLSLLRIKLIRVMIILIFIFTDSEGVLGLSS